MIIQSLDGIWKLTKPSDKNFSADVSVPGSVYTALLDSGAMEDPYYGENQYDAEKISEDDYTFSRTFSITEETAGCKEIHIVFEGIDTLAEIILNGNSVGKCNNMHRTWEFDIAPFLTGTEEKLEVRFSSPLEYIHRKNSEKPLWGVASTSPGYPHLRKAHYMFGWDWGPVLPDMGLWRSVKIIGIKGGRIDSVYNKQRFFGNTAEVEVSASFSSLTAEKPSVLFELTAPDGKVFSAKSGISDSKAVAVIKVESPELWYPAGYGGQPLYKLRTVLKSGEDIIHERTENIGLRTVKVCRTPDNDGTDGEEFAFSVNGIKIFAMGANYIPEDQLICRRTPEKTKRLINECVSAGFNMIRVWGGGIYPDDIFYDLCDKAGLLVWQDFMFACSVYSSDRNFFENVRCEITDNIKRIRNHACLAIWCGNNEAESAWQYWGIPQDEELKRAYLRMFENLIPRVLKYTDPETFYWPSSPSSGGGFNDSGAENKGDIHYWQVWHGLKPASDYRRHLPRFCSEYGFESIPCMKTVRSFAEEKDLRLNSPVMEAHQKCEDGNSKLVYYIVQSVHYPRSFSELIYASQTVQAEAIRTNVEHMRRNRGKCMGSLYWQLNDSNPVISWSSIDYFGRRKALHYYAKRFHAQVLLSASISSDNSVIFNVSSERQSDFNGKIHWRLRRNTGTIICEGTSGISVPPLSAVYCPRQQVFPDNAAGLGISAKNCILEYSLIENNARLSDSCSMFVEPKSFDFLDPQITFGVEDISGRICITLKSQAYAKGVVLELENTECRFSENWFDLFGTEKLIFIRKSALPEGTTPLMISDNLRITSYYTEMGLDNR